MLCVGVVVLVHLWFLFWKASRVVVAEAAFGVSTLPDLRRRWWIFRACGGCMATLYLGALTWLTWQRTQDPLHHLATVLVLTSVGAVVVGLLWAWVGHRLGLLTRAKRPLQQMWDGHSARKQVLRFVLLWLAMVLLVVAAMRPQGAGKQREVRREGIDVVFALDLSKSMLAQDVKPDRLSAAKAEIERCLDALRGDRVALVLFTSVSFIQSPLTTDYGAIRMYLRRAHPRMMAVGGTGIARALTIAMAVIRRSQYGEALGPAIHARVIVLVTDGEDHEWNPLLTATEAAKEGIRIYTVALGTSAGSAIPDVDESGRVQGLLTHQGDVVASRVDEGLLRLIAAESGGLYLPYRGPGSVAGPLVDELDTLQKAELTSLLSSTYEDYFYLFLVPAVVLLLFLSFLGERRRKRDAKKPPPKAPTGGRRRRLLTIALLALAAGLLGACDEPLGGTRLMPAVARGDALLAQGDAPGAILAYAEALAEDPEHPVLNYNLGLAYAAAGDLTQAQRYIVRATAVRPDDKRTRSHVWWALGNVLLAQGDDEEDPARQRALYHEALHAYQVALEDSNLHEALRNNLEQTLLRLFPPCASFDEPAPSDTPAQALSVSLEAMQRATWVLCGGSPDYFLLDVGAGYQVEATLSLQRLPQRRELMDDSARLDYGRISVRIESAGGEVLAQERVPLPQVRANQPPAKVVLRLPSFTVPEAVGSGPLYLVVQGEDYAEASYQIALKILPPCRAFEDAFEPNDSREEAARIEAGVEILRLCPDNDDWFRFPLDVGDSLFLSFLPLRDEGVRAGDQVQFGVALFRDGEVRPLWEGDTTALGESDALQYAYVDAPAATTLYWRVQGSEAAPEGPYAMHLEFFPPCPEGDDYFEDNDSVWEAAHLPAEEKRFGPLRYCQDDDDWYETVVGAGTDQAPGSPHGFTATIFYDARLGRLQLQVLDPSSLEVLGEPGTVAIDIMGWQATTVTLPGALVGERLLLLVNGDENFYYLSLEQGGGDDCSPDERPEDNPDKTPAPNDDPQPSPNQQDASPDAPPEDAPEDGAGAGAADQAREDEQGEGTPQSPEALRERRVMELLDEIERADRNLPLERAQDEMRRKSVTKDW